MSTGSFAAAADMMGHLMRHRTWQSVLILCAFLIASVAESIGFVGLLPLLDLAQAGSVDPPADGVSQAIVALLTRVGLPHTIGTMISLIVFAILLKAVLAGLAQTFLAYCVAGILTDMRVDLMRALGRARWAYFVDQSPGELATIVGSESQRAANGLVNSMMMIAMVLQAGFYLLTALVIEWKFSLGAMFAGGLVAFALHGLVRVAQRAGGEQTDLTASMLSTMIDGLQGFKAMKAMARENALVGLMTREAQRYMRVFVIGRASAIAITHLPEGIAVAMFGVLVYAALAQGEIPVSQIVVIAALGYRGIGRVNQLQKVMQSTVANYRAYCLMSDVLARTKSMPEQLTGQRQASFEREVRLEAVSFSHGDLPVLHSIDIIVPAHGVTALLGPSGAGKTTIIDLILGLRKADRGHITIDGVPIDEIDVRTWRTQIGYVPQEVQLFHRSLFENIALDEPGVTRAQAEAALLKAGAGDLLTALPDGIDSPVGQAGQRFSGGQRQRIALARALVRNPRLLLLDEATSALDPQTEQRICATLRELSRSVAVLAISHQPGIRSIADRVYRIEAGQITEKIMCQGPVLAEADAVQGAQR